MPEVPEVNGSAPPKVEVNKPSSEFLDRAKIELEVRLNLRREYEDLFKIWKNDELAVLEKKQDEVISKGLEDYYKKWQEQMKPPEPEDIQKLLDQEYETFTIPVDYVKFDGESETTERVMFTVRELPQSIEKKFYHQFKHKLIGKLQMLEAFTQAGMDKPFEEKAKAFLELFDETFDVLADAVTLVLNPFGHKKEITKEWVQNNISSDRQWRIVEAQMKVNRLRDFFSKVSTSGQSMTMMTRPSFQALQELVA